MLYLRAAIIPRKKATDVQTSRDNTAINIYNAVYRVTVVQVTKIWARPLKNQSTLQYSMTVGPILDNKVLIDRA